MLIRFHTGMNSSCWTYRAGMCSFVCVHVCGVCVCALWCVCLCAHVYVCLPSPDCVVQFLGPECEMEVNIDAKSAGALGARIACGDVSVDMYDALIATVEKEMAGDALPRFVKSDVWKALVAASPAASPAPTPVRCVRICVLVCV